MSDRDPDDWEGEALLSAKRAHANASLKAIRPTEPTPAMRRAAEADFKARKPKEPKA